MMNPFVPGLMHDIESKTEQGMWLNDLVMAVVFVSAGFSFPSKINYQFLTVGNETPMYNSFSNWKVMFSLT
ncbi:MAG: hypothetical protein JWN83_1849 [Chitinophagaceae bacterium]|nr:hypothetical protein [Chitinophagaceae bacterium]